MDVTSHRRVTHQSSHHYCLNSHVHILDSRFRNLESRADHSSDQSLEEMSSPSEQEVDLTSDAGSIESVTFLLYVPPDIVDYNPSSASQASKVHYRHAEIVDMSEEAMNIIETGIVLFQF